MLFPILYLGFALAAWGAGPTAEERAQLIESLGSEDPSERAEASQALTDAASNDLKGVLGQVRDAMRASQDPEVIRQTRDVIRAIYRRHELGIGEADYGWKIGWFLHHNRKNLSSLPLVLEVEEGGPAEKAGLLPGDVIARLDGRYLRSAHSRNEFVREVAAMKPGRETKLVIWRSGTKGAFKRYNKHMKKERVVVPVARKGSVPDEPTDDEKVKEWLRKTLG